MEEETYEREWKKSGELQDSLIRSGCVSVWVKPPTIT